ncbi:MAG: PAS domain-containing protein [Planctomycetota bacterium]
MPTWMLSPSPIVQALVSSSLLLAWLLTEMMAMHLMASSSASGWYPTAGIGLAVLWAVGLRYAWVVGVAAFLGMLAVWGYEPLPSLVVSLIKMLCYGGAAWALRLFLPPPVRLSRPRQVAALLMVMLGCAFSTALISVGSLHLIGVWPDALWAGVLSWAVGDSIGILVIAPLLVMVVSPLACSRFGQDAEPARPLKQVFREAWRPGLVILGTAGVIVALYCCTRGTPDFRIFYLGFIALPTLAMVYRLVGGLTALFVLNCSGMAAVFIHGDSGAALQDLQLVMIALAICTLLVGCYSTMRETAAADAESGKRWASLAFRGSGLGRWHWRVGSEVYETDHVLTDTLGYPSTKVENNSDWWRERMHPEDQPVVETAMRRHLEGHTEFFDAELRVRNAAGDWVWIYSQGRIIERDEQGRPKMVVGTHRDISELRLLKELQEESEAWHRSEQRFRLLADAAPVGVFQTDDKGALLYMNPAWSRITGFNLADALYRHAGAFAYAEDRNRVADAWALAIASQTTMDCEHRVQTPDGQVRWIATRARPTPPAEGRPGGFVGTAVDVTEYHEQVLLIRDSETRYRTLAEHTHDMLWRVTLDAVFTYVSPSCEQLLGYPPREMQGTNAYDYFHEADIEQVRQKHQALTPENPQFKDLHRYRRSNGSYIWFEAVGQLVYPDGDPGEAYIVGISRDVTARIEAEQQRGELEVRLRRSQKLDAIGTFATGIAHDFRNTLLAIAASVQSARKKLDPEHPADRSLELIEDACRQSMDITQSLLTFTRGQGRNKTPVNLSELVRQTIRLLNAMLPSTVQIEADLPGNGPWVLANASELQQVMMNLSTNARDALADQGGALRISLRHTPLTEQTQLVFIDEGEGMPPETIHRIFEPFFTTKSRLKGTGLGLSLVHGIVTEHGGEIEIGSTPGQGTTVTITLPTAPAPTRTTNNRTPTFEEQAR